MNERLIHVGGMWCPAGDPYFVPRLLSETGALFDGPAMNAAFRHVTDTRRAVDVGAHIGLWTRQLAGRFGEVVAFEPDELNFEALQGNLRGVGNTRLMPMALAKYPGRFSLCRDGAKNSGQGHLTPLQTAWRWVVGITLDTMDFDHLGLLKLDVEGLECDVLHGGEQTIRRCKPVVVIEENPLAARYQRKAGDARAMLESWGMYEAERVEFAADSFDVILAWRPQS